MKMLRKCIVAAIVGGLVLLAVNAGAAGAVQQEKKLFNQVTAKLDAGGTYYVFQNNKYFYASVSEWFEDLRKGLFQSKIRGLDSMQITMVTQGAKMLIQALGINELRAYAASSVLISEGAKERAPLFRNRLYFYRGQKKPQGLLWLLAGEKNAKITSIKMLPKTTIYAATGQFYPGKVWAWAKQFAPQLPFPPALMLLINAEARFQKSFKMTLENFLGKLDGVWTTVVTYEKNVQGRPVMRLAMVLPVADNQPFDLLTGQLKGVKDVKIDAAKREITINASLPSGMPAGIRDMVRPVIKQVGKALYVVSSPEVMTAMTQAAATGKGFVATPQFKKYSRGLTMEGVQFSYVDGKIFEKVLEMVKFYAKGKGMPDLTLLSASLELSTAMVVTRLDPEGVLVTSNTEHDLASISGMQANVATASILAGMLLPALNQAREKARRISCASNLKQIGLALKQYAMDHNDQFPKANNAIGLNQLITEKYLTAPQVYLCPSKQNIKAARGGKLTDKTCSYIYLGGQSEGMNPSLPLVFDKPGNHKNYLNVLFQDGHVAGFSASGLSSCEKIISFLAKRNHYNPAEKAKLLKQAGEIDKQLGYK